MSREQKPTNLYIVRVRRLQTVMEIGPKLANQNCNLLWSVKAEYNTKLGVLQAMVRSV